MPCKRDYLVRTFGEIEVKEIVSPEGLAFHNALKRQGVVSRMQIDTEGLRNQS